MVRPSELTTADATLAGPADGRSPPPPVQCGMIYYAMASERLSLCLAGQFELRRLTC